MTRSMHLGNGKQEGCKTSSRHIGAYQYTDLAAFKALPATAQCQRCLKGKVFALWTKNAK